jgi:hypothetical protein
MTKTMKRASTKTTHKVEESTSKIDRGRGGDKDREKDKDRDRQRTGFGLW